MRSIFFRNTFLISFLAVFFCLSNPVSAQDTESIPSDTPVHESRIMDLEREIDQNVFQAGEKVKLRVAYFGFTAGYIKVNVKSDTFKNRQIYRLDMTARTTGAVEWIYQAQDRFVSYMDRQGLFSWGFDYFENHNGERDTTTVRYNHNQGFFAENGSKEGKTPQYTQDILSAVYYLRTQNLEVGDRFHFPVHVGDKYYRIIIDVNKKEKVATKEGWIEALRLRPTIKDSEKLKEAKEHLQDESEGLRIWISNDERKIPLKVTVPATFGAVYGYLDQYKSD